MVDVRFLESWGPRRATPSPLPERVRPSGAPRLEPYGQAADDSLVHVVGGGAVGKDAPAQLHIARHGPVRGPAEEPLEVLSQEDLKAMRRGAPEKMALAWLLKKKTVVGNEWISQRLKCGHPANIPGYVRKVNDAGAGILWEYKNTLKSED